MEPFHTAWQIRSVFAVIAFALAFAWGANTVLAAEVESAITIARSGQVIVKDAEVISVTGGMIVAQTTWGAARISFHVQTSGSTRFVPEIGSAQALAAIRPGHTISFSGTLSMAHERPTVFASVVKDTELIRDSYTVVGTVESIDESGAAFVLVSQDTTTRVVVPHGALMSRDGNYAEVGDVQPGDSGRATGTLEVSTGTLTASRVSVVSATAEPKRETPPPAANGPGVISSIIDWLMSSRGMLSIR